MKKTIAIMVLTFIVAFVWLNYWVDAHTGGAKFIIAWTPFALWVWYWFTHPIMREIIRVIFGDDDAN